MLSAIKNDSVTIATTLRKKVLKGKTSLRKTFNKKKHQRRAIYTGSAIVIVALFLGWVITSQAQTEQEQFLQKSLHSKQEQLKLTDKQKIKTQQELDVKIKHEADLQKQIDDLSQQLQAKKASQLAEQQALAEAPQPVAQIAQPVYQPVAPIVVAGCGDNEYANFIYMHESGCRTNAVNPIGCYGIGQACPASKIAQCGTDYACQNAWFTAYAGKYGGWAGAYAFWVAHSWW